MTHNDRRNTRRPGVLVAIITGAVMAVALILLIDSFPIRLGVAAFAAIILGLLFEKMYKRKG